MKNLFLNGLMLLALLATACGNPKPKENSNPADTARITLTHAHGETAVVKNPKRVVILNYGILDSFDQLNLPVGGIAKGNLPSYLEKYGQDASIIDVGSIIEPNLEKINELNPELIIISARQAKLYDELSKIAPTLYMDIDKDNYLPSFKVLMDQLGQIFDKSDRVAQELAKIDDQIIALKDIAQKSDKKALIVLTNEGRMSAYGKGSRFGILHDVFGIAPAVADIEVATHGQPISNEFIQEVNPDILYVIDRSAAIKRNALNKEQFSNELIQVTKAYKNDKIIFLNPEIWYLSGGGLQSIQMMIDEIKGSLL